MTKRPFLVLGGSRYQLPYIEAARRLGSQVVCFDMNAEPLGKQAAHRFIQCDTSDVERAVKLAKAYDVSGVIAPATDIAVLTKAMIDEDRGLNGPSIQAAQILTDKTAFRIWRDKNGLSGPVWKAVDTSKRPTALPLEPPFIIKPNLSSGGRGARKIDNVASWQALWDSWDDGIRAAGAVAETWIDGAELSVEGFLRDGRFWLAAVTSRRTAAAPFVATTGHTWPANIEPQDQAIVLERVEQICRKIGLTDGPVDADLIYSDQPELLELSPRPGGNSLMQLVSAVFDLDYAELTVRAALGEVPTEPAQRPIVNAAAIDILHSRTPAVLTYNEAKRTLVDGVKLLELDVKPHSRIPAFHSGRDRAGAIVATGATPDAAQAAIQNQLATLDWRIKSETRS